MEYKQDTERAPGAMNSHKHSGVTKPKSIKKVIAIAVTSVIVVAVLAVSTVLVLSNVTKSNPTTSINKDDYQAVFLTNGQVYFGKLQNSTGEYLKLTNIYYLQVDSDVQQAGNTAKTNAQDQNNNVQLIKLGNELHGPRDEMQLNNQQVLFWENLKPDSRVSEAIKNYQK